ncbi:metal-dependent hydrolase [Rivularia sp. UHCC 0363]|uniref:metal-dependent hydrolase n=1 Tax=Rivularia sp. UHCC 0363 TaxID=3110244 RepID=UPI002B1F058B|nr:metal-dependent hydrolase [Rivularia sp. UHCC 0363]MEA5595708.1 metal-dependent hydrolase [Rivularia sp. UHCC 0363]
MLGISHLLVSGTATSLLLGTASPTQIAVGAIAGLLPDIDISTSIAGRVLPWASSFFESRMPHRSCTHSLLASGAIAVFAYVIVIFNPSFTNLGYALSIGYFFGWFADVFTISGVEMFWPSSMRCVCPGNKNLRLKTGSNAEYFVLVVLIAISLAVFNINNSGGMLTQFNRLIANPSGVENLYNKSASTNLIKAQIKGVRSGDRSRVEGDFLIIQTHGTGFIVQSASGEIYKAGTEAGSQIIIERITSDLGKAAITNIESITLEEEQILEALTPFNRVGAMVFVSGQINVDDSESIKLNQDPYQFPYMRLSGDSVNLEAAPFNQVIEKLGEQFATGNLQIRIINASQTITNSNFKTQFGEKG